MEPMVHAVSLVSAVSAAAVGTLFSAIWEGSFLAVCVILCLRMLPRLSAASRSVVWMNAFLLMLLLHFVPLFTAHGGSGSAAQPGVHSPGHFSTVYLDPRWSFALAGLWAMLSLWKGTQLVLCAIHLHGVARRATPIEADRELLELLQDGKDGGRAAELCTSTEVERPGVFGFFRPRILVPPVLIERLSAQELRQVVMHEMEHLRRADDWTNLLQKVGLALFPLNPVLFWVERRLCAERELACDDRVLRSSGARRAYAACLTHLAEYSIRSRSLKLVLGAWERQSELVRRVHRLLMRPHESMGARQAGMVTGGLIVGVLAGAIGLARSPQLVGFAPLAQTTLQAHSVPAVADFRDLSARPFAGSAHLVKAVMPEQPVQSPKVVKPTRTHAVLRNARLRSVQSEQAWVVMTEWNETGIPAHVVLAVEPIERTSYAAIPMGNGWLIVRI